MAFALFVLLMTQSTCADHTASVRLCVLHQTECADNMTCMHCAVPIRNAKDIAGMRAACKLARQILDEAHAAVKPGVTTDEIDQVVIIVFCITQCYRCMLVLSSVQQKLARKSKSSLSFKQETMFARLVASLRFKHQQTLLSIIPSIESKA